MKKETQEKQRSDNQLNKDNDTHLKALREKLKDNRHDLKRKEDKINEG